MKLQIQFLSAILLLLGFSACTKPKAPSLQQIQNVKISKLSSDSLLLSADAQYYNPNAIPGKLTKTNIDVWVNEVLVGTIHQTSISDIPKSSQFNVPFEIVFNPNQLLAQNDGFLRQALKSFFSNQLIVNYSGTNTMEVLNIPFNVSVNHTDTLAFNLLN